MGGSSFAASGFLTVLIGLAVVLACFVPYVAWSYRRYGTVRPGHAVLLVAVALYAVGLWVYTILPLPADPEQWCTAHSVAPQLRPLQFVADVRGFSSGGLLRNRALLQVVLNVALFVPLGALVRALSNWSVLRVAGVGLAVSLLVELTQLTGNWGLYPCAYRLFDVDDLLINTAGMSLGVLAAPVFRRLARRSSMSREKVPAEVTTGRRLLGMFTDVVAVEVLGVFFWVVLALSRYSTDTNGIEAPALWQRALVMDVAPALLLLLLVPWLCKGATVGQLATRVRPVRIDGGRPGHVQLLVRFLTGSGGYFLLQAGDQVVGGSSLATLARLLGVASIVLAWRSRGHRGLSGVASRVTVLDERSDPHDAARILLQGPTWELRRMSTAVLGLFTTAYVVLVVVGALAQASSTTGPIILVILLATFAALTVGMAVYLILNGVTMVRRERLSLGNLLSLLVGTGSIALLIASVVVLLLGRGWVFVAAVAVLALSGYLGFLMTAFVSYGLLYGRLMPQVGVDAVVTLGSGLLGSRVPPLLASRLERALVIFQAEQARGHRPLMICSGGQGAREEIAEATAMAWYLRDRGVPADVLVEEDRSRSTEENLQFSWALTQSRGGEQIVAVTNDFHAFRAALIARELGIPAQVVGSPTARYYFPSAVLREFVGVLARRRLVYGATGLLLAGSAGALAHLILA